MKRSLFIAIFIMTAGCGLFAQTTPYKVVFDLTTGDSATHQRVIGWMKGILQSHPDAKMEVVFYGKSLPMVEKGSSSVESDIQTLAAQKNISFTVCEQAMKKHNVDKSMLIQGVKTVPDGIYEIIIRQSEGYGYIKVTN